jgi:hypothetical protein
MHKEEQLSLYYCGIKSEREMVARDQGIQREYYEVHLPQRAEL